MKKSLVALAVLGAFAGSAAAQSSVSIYGIADVWLGSSKDGAPGTRSTSTLGDGGLSSSRLGFTGKEDLGGGLSAVFTLEGNLDIDNGTSGGLKFDRQSFVGFEGGFGAVHLGKVWTSFYDVEALAFSVFDSAFTPEYIAFDSLQYTTNPDNGIKYVSPDFGGFVGSASYSIDERATGNVKAGALSLSYTGGPLFVGVSYQQEKDTTSPESEAFTRIGASYDLGMAVVKANYGGYKEKLSNDSSTDFSVGVDVPLSDALTLAAGYARGSYEAGGVDSGEGSAFAIGATYSLSNRTTVYAGYTDGERENAAGATTREVKLYAVGVRHSF